jgi:hypothetical protein
MTSLAKALLASAIALSLSGPASAGPTDTDGLNLLEHNTFQIMDGKVVRTYVDRSRSFLGEDRTLPNGASLHGDFFGKETSEGTVY